MGKVVTRTAGATAIALLSVASLAGCSSSAKKTVKATASSVVDSVTPGADTGSTSTTAVDTSADTSSDTSTDTGTSTSTDTSSDTSTDTSATTDTGSDSGAVTRAGVDWAAKATDYRGRDGLLVTYSCPPGGTAGSVWGSGPYTDDSSVCTAAVHAGLITLTKGGKVQIRIAKGEQSYAASTRNGITTSSYGSWSGSYVFPKANPGGQTG